MLVLGIHILFYRVILKMVGTGSTKHLEKYCVWARVLLVTRLTLLCHSSRNKHENYIFGVSIFGIEGFLARIPNVNQTHLLHKEVYSLIHVLFLRVSRRRAHQGFEIMLLAKFCLEACN